MSGSACYAALQIATTIAVEHTVRLRTSPIRVRWAEGVHLALERRKDRRPTLVLHNITGLRIRTQVDFRAGIFITLKRLDEVEYMVATKTTCMWHINTVYLTGPLVATM